jgi:Fur family zinc uptake transcriptional regulator
MIDKMVAAGAKRLAPITVYRALDFLVENGFVHRLASRNAFVACPFHHKPDELVVFMICDHCGGVDEALSDDLSKSLSVLTESHGFAPRLRIIECGGACAHCRDQTKAA